MTASATEAIQAPAPAAADGPFRPSAAGWVARLTVMGGLIAALIIVTLIVPQFWADRIGLAAIYVLIGLSLNIIMGYVGQVSLGHHAFVGLAAFMSAYMVSEKGQSFGVGLMVAGLSGALSAGLLGLVALRIKGLYLALITLTYGFVASNSLFEIPAFTGGGQGLKAPRPEGFTTDRSYAFLCIGFAVVAILVDWRLVKSKVGRAILAIKESEAVASSYAVNVTAYKVLAFVVSGTMAGIAGGLFAHRTTTVVANDFVFSKALLWVLMVVVGGLGRRPGVVIGSAFFALFEFLMPLVKPLSHFLETTLERDPEEFVGPIGALLAILTIILHPGGIGDQVAPITRWFSGRKFTFHEEEHHGTRGAAAGVMGALGLAKEGDEEREATAEEKGAEAPEDGQAKAPPPPPPPPPAAEGAVDAGRAAPDETAEIPAAGETASIPAAAEDAGPSTDESLAAATGADEPPKKRRSRKKGGK